MTHDVGHPEQLPAWRLFCWNWLVLGLMAATLFLAMALGGFSLVSASLVKPVLVVGAYLGYAHYKSYWAHKRDSRVVFILGSTGQVLLVSVLMTPMTYIAAATNLPMPITRSVSTGWAISISSIATTRCWSSPYSPIR